MLEHYLVIGLRFECSLIQIYLCNVQSDHLQVYRKHSADVDAQIPFERCLILMFNWTHIGFYMQFVPGVCMTREKNLLPWKVYISVSRKNCFTGNKRVLLCWQMGGHLLSTIKFQLKYLSYVKLFNSVQLSAVRLILNGGCMQWMVVSENSMCIFNLKKREGKITRKKKGKCTGRGFLLS